jgi:uncharacterized membrane protein YkvA (DUF1232 family)
MQLITKLKEKAKQLKSETQVLMLAYRDQRTPLMAKILIWITVAYLLSPIDLIPDFIPILGLLDDLIIVPLLITLSLRQIPNIVLAEAREKVKANPPNFKKGNWLIGGVIIAIWLIVLYYLFRYFGRNKNPIEK